MNRLLLIPVFIFVTACATSIPTPHYDAVFGDAVRQAKAKMIINADAGTNPDQVAGMDGKSAKEAITLYQGTFKAPPPAVNVINIGGTIGGNK